MSTKSLTQQRFAPLCTPIPITPTRGVLHRKSWGRGCKGVQIPAKTQSQQGKDARNEGSPMERNIHRIDEIRERKVEERQQRQIVAAALNRAAQELRVLEAMQERRRR